jgi:hypothetical protein
VSNNPTTLLLNILDIVCGKMMHDGFDGAENIFVCFL